MVTDQITSADQPMPRHAGKGIANHEFYRAGDTSPHAHHEYIGRVKKTQHRRRGRKEGYNKAARVRYHR